MGRGLFTCPHGRSRGRSRSSSQRHSRELPGPERCPSPEARVIPSAPPWPGLPEPRGEWGGWGDTGQRIGWGPSGMGTHPKPSHPCMGLRTCSRGRWRPDPPAPGWQPLVPSLSSSGKRHRTGWRSRSEQPQPQPRRGWGQRQGSGTAHAWSLHLGGRPERSRTTRTAQTPGWMDRWTACRALAVYFCLARGCAAGQLGRGPLRRCPPRAAGSPASTGRWSAGSGAAPGPRAWCAG